MLPFLLNGVDGMSVKQDKAAPRTVADIERKYNFGKSFADIMGLIDDTRNEVDSAYSELQNEITEQSTSIRRDTERHRSKVSTFQGVRLLSSRDRTRRSCRGSFCAVRCFCCRGR